MKPPILVIESHIPYLLIADDDPEDRRDFIDEFRRQNKGASVNYVNNGKELMQVLTHCLPDRLPKVLLLDYQMPDLVATEILLQLSANKSFRSIVKIIWSTSQRTRDMEDCLRLGAAHYLIKPSTIAELEKLVGELTFFFNQAVNFPT